MSTFVRRRAVRTAAAASLVLLVPVLGACGFNAQTDQVYQPSVGANFHDGTVDVLGAVVVSGGEGSGTFVASLANKSVSKAETLTGITGEDGVQVQLVRPVEVPAGGLVNLATRGAASVSGESVSAGSFARLTLTFDSGETAELNMPVIARSGEYSDVAPAIAPASASATP